MDQFEEFWNQTSLEQTFLNSVAIYDFEPKNTKNSWKYCSIRGGQNLWFRLCNSQPIHVLNWLEKNGGLPPKTAEKIDFEKKYKNLDLR